MTAITKACLNINFVFARRNTSFGNNLYFCFEQSFSSSLFNNVIFMNWNDRIFFFLNLYQFCSIYTFERRVLFWFESHSSFFWWVNHFVLYQYQIQYIFENEILKSFHYFMSWIVFFNFNFVFITVRRALIRLNFRHAIFKTFSIMLFILFIIIRWSNQKSSTLF